MTSDQRSDRAFAAIVAIAILAPPIVTYASGSPWWVCLIGWGVAALVFVA